MENIFKIIGPLGIISITIGILVKKKTTEDIFYVLGGILLEAYSIYIRDWIFIVLQIIFTLAAVYDLVKIKFFKK